jgi:hypothetical protein
MKRIVLRLQDDLDWAQIIREVIRRPLDPKSGADIDEIRRGVRVLDALDQADGALELEDADWEHLKIKTLAMPWAIIDKRILEFVDDVTEPK